MCVCVRAVSSWPNVVLVTPTVVGISHNSCLELVVIVAGVFLLLIGL